MTEHTWLYHKLFIDPTDGEAAADHVVTQYVGPVSESLIKQGWTDGFFFLRYGEGGFHIRHRVRLTGVVDAATVGAYLRDAAKKFDVIVRVEDARYKRETAKYGGSQGIELSERAFCASSRFAISCLERTSGRPNLRLIVAMLAFDALLTIGDVRGSARAALLCDYASHWKAFVGNWQGASARDFEPRPQLSATLAEQFVASDGRLDAVAELIGPRLDLWLFELKACLAGLDALSQTGLLITSPVNILCNLAHTTNNRLGVGPGDEVLIAEALRQADALRENDPSWEAVAGALTARVPSILVLEGDAERRLVDWHSSAVDDGALWLESPAVPTQWAPFDLWTQLAEIHPGGAELAQRLRFGPEHEEDPGCPLLPDAAGVHCAIHRWLVTLSTRPFVVVLNAVDEADPDSLLALAYIVRALEDVLIALILRTSGRIQNDLWDQLLPRLMAETEIVHIQGGPPANNQTRVRLGLPTSLEYGIASCRAGALRTGSRILVKQLTENGAALSPNAEGTAWTYLAMAMLSQSQFQFVASAVTGAMALQPTPQRRRLLRRTLMFALRGQGEGIALRELGLAARHELCTSVIEPTEEAWLRLDSALGCSLDDPEGVHESFLASIVDSSEHAASAQCRVAANLWLAAFHTVNGNAPAAISHQRAGLALLEALEDESRGLSTRVRLGAALFGLGLCAEAAPHLELAAHGALRLGKFEIAAECWCYAARARTAMGDLVHAEELLADAVARGRGVWAQRRAHLLRLHARAVLALARGAPGAAEAMVDCLMKDLDGDVDGEPTWLARIMCECTYVLADVATANGDGATATKWALQGLHLSEDSAREERAALIAAGRNRLDQVLRRSFEVPSEPDDER